MGRFKHSRVFHYISALVGTGTVHNIEHLPKKARSLILLVQIMLVASLAYLTMAVGSLDGNPLGVEDINVVQFYDWIVGTPLLLIDLAFLARMDVPEVRLWVYPACTLRARITSCILRRCSSSAPSTFL
jgi:bacteriorhodopsin